MSLDWTDKVKAAMETYHPLWELIECSKTKNMSWSVDAILKLKSPSPSFNNYYQIFRNNTLTALTLMAFLLDPKSDQNLMNSNQQNLVFNNLYRVFQPPNVSKFLLYKRNEARFEEGRELDARDYWERLSHGEFKELAATAMDFNKIPSSAYEKCFKVPSIYSFDFETLEKIAAIKLDAN